MALQQFLVRMAHNTLTLPNPVDDVWTNNTWCGCELKHSHWFVLMFLVWNVHFYVEVYIPGRLAAPHSFIIPVQELERSKNMLIPLHELGCSLPWLHVLELSILIIIIIIIILLHVTPVPAFPQWHAVVGIGWFSSGCSGRPGLFMSISCAISTTVNAGTRGPVESSQCANGTTRFLVLLRLGIVRLCLFHFPHVARSHVVQTKSELLGSCWRLSGILIDRARS